MQSICGKAALSQRLKTCAVYSNLEQADTRIKYSKGTQNKLGLDYIIYTSHILQQVAL